jgi:hypothetical protein
MYRAIENLEDLRTVMNSPESWQLDFKMFVNPAEWWELAKDIAAFANYLGGVILVGVEELPSGMPQLCGIGAQDAEALKGAYEMAARDKCLPRPLVTMTILNVPELDGRCLLAVNVEPVPDQIVGAMFYLRNKAGDPTTCDAWRFPVRIGKHNVPITPDRIPMFIDAKSRRTAIRLCSITPGSIPLLVWRRPSNQFDEEPQAEGILDVEVDLAANVMRARRQRSDGGTSFAVPLEDVESVWEETRYNWRIRVTGWLDAQNRYVTNPSNAVFKR